MPEAACPAPLLPPGPVALRVTSNFSFLHGASHPEELVEQAVALGYGALAITDECSLAGVVRAHAACKAQPAPARLRLIIGARFRIEPDGAGAEDRVTAAGTAVPAGGAAPAAKRRRRPAPPGGASAAQAQATAPLHLVLLATSREGYGHLAELITVGRRRSVKGSYRLCRADLARGLPDCLALWIPDESQDARPGRWLAERFPGRAWLAASLHCGPDDAARLARLHALGAEAGLPVLAADEVLMHSRGRRALQDVLTAIRLRVPVAEAGLALQPSGERHLRAPATLERVYPPALLAEARRAAALCRFSLDELRYEYPEEIVPPGFTATTYLRHLTLDGLRTRYPAGTPAGIARQMEHELALIEELAYEAYFLTVHDIVRYARSRGILCQGRGSAANSLVCYALGITEVDPSRSSLLFERFISRERNEPPDIDVDFEHQRREEVIQYLYAKYGRERAGIAATVITYRLKSTVRDVGKALGLEPAQVDRLSRSLAWWDKGRLADERLQALGFDPHSPVMRQLQALVAQLRGFPRHLSQHVGGFVIARDRLSRLVPVENAAMPERTIIQWDKDDLDALGLLKVDVLALGMLSAIRRALEMVSAVRGRPFALRDVPSEDAAVYDMIGHADTIGVFQIESRAQMAMLPRLRPRNFYDLVIEIAIIRPGPIQGGMVHPYLRRRQAQEEVTYPSPAVRGVLERTLGVPIFQEQVMQLAIVAAGFSPGEADHLRRSMAAWKRKGGLEKFEARLLDGMRQRGYPEAFAQAIWQQIQGFGEYGFPESHSASFALLAYVSAWLKCHEPAAFTAALLNSLPMGFYGPAQLIQDARRHGVEVRAVDVASSAWECTLEPASAPATAPAPPQPGTPAELPRGIPPQPAIRLGLNRVDGFNAAAAQRIVAARHQAPYADVPDLARRAALNRHELRCLADAGALASLAGHRRHAHWQAAGALPLHLPPAARSMALRGAALQETTPLAAPHTAPHTAPQAASMQPASPPPGPLPNRLPPTAAPGLLARASFRETAPSLAAPSEGEDLVADYAALGFSLGRHPLALLRRRLHDMRLLSAADLRRLPHGRPARMAGLVTGRQRPGTASGVVFVTLEDETGMANIVVYGRLAERQRRELLGARLMGVWGVVQCEGEVVHLLARRLVDYTPLLGRLTTTSRDFH